MSDAALLPAATRRWLATEAGVPADAEATRLAGGNANAAFRLTWSEGDVFLRTPPDDPIDPSAHDFTREHTLLSALADTPVPTARPLALCADRSIPRAPFLLVEHLDGLSLTDRLPQTYAAPSDAAADLGTAMVDALAALHAVDWRAVGLADFGRPDGFLARQVPRWSRQFERNRRRELPRFHSVAQLLTASLPPESEPTIMHGDYHLDNALFHPERPELLAVIDWEMATIGDPLLDLGLLLAFWGERSVAPPAMPRIQAVSRVPGAPTREDLAARYAEMTGRSIEHLDFYMALAFWKLAAIVEGAFTQYLDGRLRTEYAQRLGDDVPALLAEAEHHLRP